MNTFSSIGLTIISSAPLSITSASRFGLFKDVTAKINASLFFSLSSVIIFFPNLT